MNIGKKIIFSLRRNAPLLFTITTCAGIVATAYFSGKAALKVDKVLNEAKEQELKDPKTKIEIIKAVLPAVITGTGTIGMNIAGYLYNHKILNGVTAAFSVLNTSYQAMQLSMTPEKIQQAEIAIDHKKIEDNLPELLKKYPGDEYTLWCDNYRKRPFWAREADIYKACAQLNKDLMNPNFSRHFGTAGLDEFYEYVQGEKEPQDSLWGWDIDYMNCEWDCGFLEIGWYTDEFTDADGNTYTCNHIQWWCEPMLNYWNYDYEKGLAD